MRKPSLPDLNPYETPGIERLNHTSVYLWPLSADKRLSFSVQIEEGQLTKCVEANSRLVNPYFWTSFFCFFAFMITGLMWLASSDFDFMSISICTITFLSLFFVVPRCFSHWHALRAGQRFKWLWGDVRGEISIHGLNWRSDTVEIQLPWDSFHTVVLEPSCVWLSTQYPFSMDFPLHRDWVDTTTWQEIREVTLAHAGIFVRWSQALLSSQSGFVSRQQICIASPACTMTAKRIGETSVRLETDFLVFSLQREFRQSLVIPRDQFCENDADTAWDLLGEEIKD